jgi:hypothetical protein
MGDIDVPDEDSPLLRNRVALPLVHCLHEARPGEELTPERAAALLLEEEARSSA